jgi:hypothetical protein
VTLTLEIRPEVEEALARRAATQGLEMTDYALSILEKAAGKPLEPVASGSTAMDLVELFAPLRGLNLDFERDQDLSGDIDL